MNTKKCYGYKGHHACGKDYPDHILPVEEFASDASQKDGKHHSCKKCKRYYSGMRNPKRKLWYGLAGSQKEYYSLSKEGRAKIRARIHNSPSSNTPSYRAHRKLPKVQRPKGKRVTIFKPDDPRGFVYIFKDHMKSVNGWLYYYKVGASHDPQERLNQANTWGDFECLYESEMVDECASLEKEVHQALSKYRVKGEWFQCDKTFIINKIEELVDARKEQAVAEQKVS